MRSLHTQAWLLPCRLKRDSSVWCGVETGIQEARWSSPAPSHSDRGLQSGRARREDHCRLALQNPSCPRIVTVLQLEVPASQGEQSARPSGAHLYNKPFQAPCHNVKKTSGDTETKPDETGSRHNSDKSTCWGNSYSASPVRLWSFQYLLLLANKNGKYHQQGKDRLAYIQVANQPTAKTT